MKDDTIEHPLYKQIQGDIDRIEKIQTKYRRYYYIFRISQILLTGTMTFLSGQESSNNKLILIFGVLVTAITAIETLYRFDSKKDAYSLALFDYRSIRDDFIFYNIQGNINPVNEKELFDRFVRAKSGQRKLVTSSATITSQSEMLGGEV